MQDKIKFAVVGCGHIGKRHAAMIIDNAECELVALCDTVPKEVMDTGYHDVPFFISIEALLGSGILFDVACVATPNGLHEEHALKILMASHHVVIEKPMALTAAGCKRIIAEAEKQQKQVFCVMQNRFSPAAAWLKGIVSKNILGAIYIVAINCYWNRDERYYTGKNWHGTKELDGGTLFTQFSHFVDTIHWLFGDIKNINSRIYNFNHGGLIDFEDTGFVNFDLVNGGSGCLNYSTAVWKENLESSLTVIAQNGTVKIGGQYMDEVKACNIKDDGMLELKHSTASTNHQFIIENVADVLKRRMPNSINAADGMKVVETIERVYAAAKTHPENELIISSL